MDAHQLKQWSNRLDELGERICGCFARRDLHARAHAYRHITLSMLALAFLAAVRAEADQPR